MNVERDFAKAQGIPVKAQSVAIDAGSSLQKKVEAAIAPLKVFQWRVLFHFSHVIVPDSALCKDKEYYLQFKLFEHITKFPFTCSGTVLNINRLRVHYFFSGSKDIDKALDNLLIDIRITEGESWEKALFKGRSLPLQYFTSKYCRIESPLMGRCVSLFSGDISQHVSLQVFTGNS
eukprot:TRINITY_DN3319_c0_g1_i1.p1 TRINITY_DN3319_c0_g1~~TRINITY_DN3319_c0_g1_i1.p1  ORF type:complete len:176 (-),score=26.72 TRINITY_DN3319_c0_g1_i1:559-1086(-)